MLNFVDKTLHQMPFPVQPAIILAGFLGSLVRWDDRLDLAFNNPIHEVLCGIATVSN